MSFDLTARDIERLQGVHPHLKAVVLDAAKSTTVKFIVIEGLRTVERQRELVEAGASRTMDSRHIHGLAVDLGAVVCGKVTWQPKIYTKIADAMLSSAAKLSHPITWGGGWASFPDLVHFELNRKFYP